MEAFLSQHSEKIFALTRIIFGVLFLFHGLQKFGLLGGEMASDPLMIVAGVIELVGGGLIAIGFFTRWAAFICSGQMAVAYFMAHLPQGFIPLLNGGELAIIYSWFFLYVASRGAGIWSVDAQQGR